MMADTSLKNSRELVIVHSSDVHLGTDSLGSARSAERLFVLREVLRTAVQLGADLVLLAGDTFDHNRQPSELLGRVVETMDEFGLPIVILPGNHDPLTPDSVFRHEAFGRSPNVLVLGLTVDEAAVFPELELEVWGRAHKDYFDMSPLQSPRSRSLTWHLAAAHGHYVDASAESDRQFGSWLIRPEDLEAAEADYIALGHWNRPVRVGDGQVQAYYSGSPDYAGTVNVVRLSPVRGVEVTRAPLSFDLSE